jgi:glycosyltransferase involved in cell wall biosynthesis
MAQLSVYLLTFNSARLLEQSLASLEGLADDLVVIDSGSSDQTEEIAARFGARFIRHTLTSFTDQRIFAVGQCRHDWVLTIDSDELLSPALRDRIAGMKASDFSCGGAWPDAFGIRRDWYFLNRQISCFYPSRCPDHPIRLFRKDKASYVIGRHVHEAMSGFSRAMPIEESILHYTCDSIDDMYSKINAYSTLAAKDMEAKGQRSNWIKIFIVPWLIAVRWYVGFGGWRDGAIGIIHFRYVHDMVYQKYLKLKYDLRV